MIRILFFTLLFLAGVSTPVSAAVAAPPVKTEISTPTRADLEAELGRKLTFRERLAVKTMARQQKRAIRKASNAENGEGNGMAIAGFVCGVVGLFVAGIILGILGIVFGAIGLRRAKQEGRPLKGLAIAGLVCGIIGVAGAIIILAVM